MSIVAFLKKFFIRYGKIIIRVGGIIGLIAAVFFLVSGIYFLCQNSTSKDSQDFFSTWNIEVQQDSRAIVLEPDGIEFDIIWDMEEIEVFKVVTDVDIQEKELFIGSASQEDVRSYLGGIEYDKITALWILPTRADYQRFDGDKIPAVPVSQEFWIDTSAGKGTRDLIWYPERDKASLVIMNADGSAGLDLSVQVKTKAAILFMAGIGNLTSGIFLLLLSLMAILYTRRAPNVVYPRPLIVYPNKEEKQESGA